MQRGFVFLLLGCLCGTWMFVDGAILPGVLTLGSGYDIVTGQLRLASIVDFTYKQGKNFTYPNSSVVYSYPDQMNVQQNWVYFQEISSEVSYSATSLASTLQAGLTVGGSVPTYALAGSASIKFATQYLTSRELFSSIVVTTTTASVYEAELAYYANLKFEPYWMEDVKSLPIAYDYNTYSMFITQYGTHIISNVFMGGQGVMWTAVNAADAQTHSSAEVGAQASIQFAWLQAGGNINSNTSQASEWFRENSYIATQLLGGEERYSHDLTQWNQWVESFPLYPHYLASPQFPLSLVPMSLLVRFFSGDNNLANNMDKAVAEYGAKYPFPPDPQCEQQIYCNVTDDPARNFTCCPFDTPVCCGAGCCAAGSTCNSDGSCEQPEEQICCTVNGGQIGLASEGTLVACMPVNLSGGSLNYSVQIQSTNIFAHAYVGISQSCALSFATEEQWKGPGTWVQAGSLYGSGQGSGYLEVSLFCHNPFGGCAFEQTDVILCGPSDGTSGCSYFNWKY